ncbi:hypothetical protein EB118_06355 [bacterium]|nr:hypothetical protein [bacterium]NDC94378.1 hypothetical protein [bacterium]NDD83918.1 hypothetical protein [bacterium]NDG29700.1 hypothetical protein [bacterium]
MSFFFEGNGYFNGSVLTGSTVSNSAVNTSAISGCTIDMLSTSGNLTNIVNVKDPIQPQDAATKKYIDTLGTTQTINLSNTNSSVISNNVKGSFVVTVTNLVLNGPCGIFNISKSEGFQQPHIVRTSGAPGYNTNVFLSVNWPPNSSISLNKTGAEYDGSYFVKIF